MLPLYNFYEIRTSRGQEGSLHRRSFQPREGDPMTLFLWQNDAGKLVHFQFLIGEEFVEWTPAGVVCGRTDRDPASAQDRGSGVRTLTARADREALQTALNVLSRSSMPDGLGAEIGEALQAADRPD